MQRLQIVIIVTVRTGALTPKLMGRVNCQRNANFEMARYIQNWLGKHKVIKMNSLGTFLKS